VDLDKKKKRKKQKESGLSQAMVELNLGPRE